MPRRQQAPCGIESRWGSVSIFADVQKYLEILFLGSREAPPLGSDDGGVQAEGRGCSRKGAGGHSGQRGHAVTDRAQEPLAALE